VDPLTITTERDVARDVLSHWIVDQATRTDPPLRVLEVGCGRRWTVDVGEADVRITGIDLDEAALTHRRDVVGDLDEAILGDVRTVPFLKGAYDVTYSSFVLEHVADAESVLDGMVDALKDGGLLVLRIPDKYSVFGFLSRALPFRVHVLWKRWVEGNRNAGKPGHDPYPVVYDDVVSRRGLHDYARQRGLELLDEAGTNPHIAALGRLAPVGMAVQKLLALLSFGRLAGTHNNLTVVIRKPSQEP
jgi:SAM-dependent methyltransferase